MTDIDIAEDRLGAIGDPVGLAGGQGTVYELIEHPDWLYKRYHEDLDVDPDGLRGLVRWGRGLHGRDQRILDVRTSWPRYVVRHDRGHGVVFRRANRRFTHDHDGRVLGTDLQFACYKTGAWAGAGPAGPRTAVAIVYRYAQVLDVLHRGHVAYGDMSFTNMLWSSSTPRPHVFLIDCDAAWLTTGPRGLPPGHTHLWIDPWVDPWTRLGPHEARATDLFKLALLFVRTYYNSITDFVDESTRLVRLGDRPPVSARIAHLVQSGLTRNTTTRMDEASADRWFGPLVALDRRLEARGMR